MGTRLARLVTAPLGDAGTAKGGGRPLDNQAMGDPFPAAYRKDSRQDKRSAGSSWRINPPELSDCSNFSG